MASAATYEHLPDLLRIAADPRYGMARQMVVHQLPRFKKSPDVQALLQRLLEDRDVALHAMGALRRIAGPDAVLPHLRDVQAAHGDDPIGRAASREIRKAESAAMKRRQRGTHRPALLTVTARPL
jgi:hypothetical protein